MPLDLCMVSPSREHRLLVRATAKIVDGILCQGTPFIENKTARMSRAALHLDNAAAIGHKERSA
jgi:hypothetical protein